MRTSSPSSARRYRSSRSRWRRASPGRGSTPWTASTSSTPAARASTSSGTRLTCRPDCSRHGPAAARSTRSCSVTASVCRRAGDTIPVGGKTIENRFHFSNFQFRMGIGRDIVLGGRPRGATWQLGLAAHTVHYWLVQSDFVQSAVRPQEEWWVEWTPTWGLTLRFPELELRYNGRVTKGTGRPSTQSTPTFLADAAGVRSGDLLVAPSGPITLQGVSVV